MPSQVRNSIMIRCSMQLQFSTVYCSTLQYSTAQQCMFCSWFFTISCSWYIEEWLEFMKYTIANLIFLEPDNYANALHSFNFFFFTTSNSLCLCLSKHTCICHGLYLFYSCFFSSDIYAMNGEPVSALALVVLSYGPEEKVVHASLYWVVHNN